MKSRVTSIGQSGWVFNNIEQQYKLRKIAEIIKWLYINDRAFDSKEEWKESFITFLEETI